MAKRHGLRQSHAKLVENLVQGSEKRWTASEIKDVLWDMWGRTQPTAREIGSFLNIHPQMQRVNKYGPCAEYIWKEF